MRNRTTRRTNELGAWSRRRASIWTAALVFSLAACGNDDTDPLELGVPDGAATMDMGPPPMDAGEASDAAPATDAALPDAQPMDAAADLGPEDTGATDTGAEDTGAEDAGPEDMDAADTGPGDLGPPDAGTPDAGPGDTGPIDAGGPPMICNPTFGMTPPTCGGTPTGSWNFTEACGQTLLEQQFLGQCPLATLSNRTRTATGTLSFQGTGYTLNLVDRFSIDADIPAVCALAVGGCSAIPGVLTSFGATGTCTMGSTGNCLCSVSAVLNQMETGTFTVSGGVLTAGSRVYDHCLTPAASTLEIRERQTGSVYVLRP